MTFVDERFLGPFSIEQERYESKPVRGRYAGQVFHWVVRKRSDPGWRPYRTATLAEARDLVANLIQPGVLSR